MVKLQQSLLAAELPSITAFLEELLAGAGAAGTVALLPEDGEAARRTIAELRLQLAISVFGLRRSPGGNEPGNDLSIDPSNDPGNDPGANNQPGHPLDSFLSRLTDAEFNIPISWVRGNIATALIDTTRVLLLPEIQSSAHADEILAGLSQQADISSKVEDWLIDFSAAKRLPLSIIADVLAYNQLFQRSGTRVLAAWLRRDVLSETAEHRLTAALDLVLVGNHWFSRGRDHR